MSRVEDDKSLLAMKAARMSTGSIAWTLGWTDNRVERRLAELEKRAADVVTVPQRPVTPERAPVANPVRMPKPAPCPEPRRIPEGEGVVTRTFHLAAAGMGAAVLLDDHRVVFTETGSGFVKRDGELKPIELGQQIPVAGGEGCFHLVAARG